MRTAFWEAFWTGLACPTELFGERQHRDYRRLGRVDAAWKSVGAFIYESIDSVADESDQYRRRQAK